MKQLDEDSWKLGYNTAAAELRTKGVTASLDADDAWPMRCGWFALCENSATTTVKHPILGAVPCCERCARRATA